MPRWEPHARERLMTASLDLFETQGYEATTVADIAARAEVTPRTLFRHFADKREVLFGNAAEFHGRITSALDEMPPRVAPVAACLDALRACADLFPRRGHEFLRRRAKVIAAAEELRDREHRKLRAISADVASTLNGRGVVERDATVLADYAVFVVLVQASDLWVQDPTTSFGDAVDRAHGAAVALLGASAGGPAEADEADD